MYLPLPITPSSIASYHLASNHKFMRYVGISQPVALVLRPASERNLDKLEISGLRRPAQAGSNDTFVRFGSTPAVCATLKNGLLLDVEQTKSMGKRTSQF